MDSSQVYYVSAFTPNEQATLKKLFGKDLFGAGYSSKNDLKDEQVQRILSLIKPSMRAYFKTSEVLPILKERKALMDSEIEHLEANALAREEQSVRLIDYLLNKGSYGIGMLYCCLVDTSSKVPAHYRLAGELKRIVQTECALATDEEPFSPLLANGTSDYADQDIQVAVQALASVPVSSKTARSLLANLSLNAYDHLINSNSLGKICLFWLKSRTTSCLEELTRALVLTKDLGRYVTVLSTCSLEMPGVKAFFLSLEADWVYVGFYLGYSQREVSVYTSKNPENFENQVTDFLMTWRLPDIGGATLPLLHRLRELSGIPEDIDRKPLERSDKATHEHRSRHLKTDYIGKPLRSLDSFPRQSSYQSSPNSSLTSGYSSQYSRMNSNGSTDEWPSPFSTREHSRPSTSDHSHPLESHTHSAVKSLSQKSTLSNGKSGTSTFRNGMGHTGDVLSLNGDVADDDPPVETLYRDGDFNGGGNVTAARLPAKSEKMSSNDPSDSKSQSSPLLTNGRSPQSLNSHTATTPSTSQIAVEDFSEFFEGEDHYEDQAPYRGKRVVLLLKVGTSVSKQYQPPFNTLDIRDQDPVIEEISDESDDEVVAAPSSRAPLAIECAPGHTDSHVEKTLQFGIDLSLNQSHAHHENKQIDLPTPGHQSSDTDLSTQDQSEMSKSSQPLSESIDTSLNVANGHKEHHEEPSNQIEPSLSPVPSPIPASSSSMALQSEPHPSQEPFELLPDAQSQSSHSFDTSKPGTVSDDQMENASRSMEEPASVASAESVSLQVESVGGSSSSTEEAFETCPQDLVLAIQDANGLEVLIALLESGAKASLPTEAGVYPIHIATAEREHEKLMLLLNHDVDINAQRRDGKSALHIACINGDFQSIQILLEKGANPRLQDSQGYTCLHHRAVLESSDIVTYLLHNGTPPDVPSHGSLFTPLLVCSFIGDSTAESALLLLGNGANANGCLEADSKPLVTACTMGAEQMVEVLVGNGAEVNITDQHGNTPLLVAILNDHIDLAKNLCSQRSADGVSAAVDVCKPNKAGMTPLMAAVTRSNTGLVKDLLKRGARVNVKRMVEKMSLGVYGERDVELTALSEATLVGSLEIVQLLIDYRAEINSMSEKMIPPICFAIRGNAVSVVELLLKQNDMDRTVQGISWPFIVAVDTKNTHCAQLLLDRYHGGLDALLEDGTRHGLRDLVMHIHTYQQLVDPQSHDTATSATETVVSPPQQEIRLQSQPEEGGVSVSNAPAQAAQADLDNGSSEVASDSESTHTSGEFGLPLNELNLPVDLTVRNSSAESPSTNGETPDSQTLSPQKLSTTEAAVPDDVFPTTSFHEELASTETSLAQSLPSSPQLSGASMVAVTSSDPPPSAFNDFSHSQEQETSRQCSLNDLGAVESPAQSSPAPVCSTSNVIKNKLTSEDGDSHLGEAVASGTAGQSSPPVERQEFSQPQVADIDNAHQPQTTVDDGGQTSQRPPSPTSESTVPRVLDRAGGAEVLNEFAQICILAVCNSIGQERLVEVATASGMDHISTFFLQYFYESSGFCRRGELLHGFLGGPPSPLAFIINHSLLTKASFYATLEEMGRQDFPKLLRSALLQFDGNEVVPASATVLIDRLFDLSYVIGTRGNPVGRDAHEMALMELMRQRSGLTSQLPALPRPPEEPRHEPSADGGYRLGTSEKPNESASTSQDTAASVSTDKPTTPPSSKQGASVSPTIQQVSPSFSTDPSSEQKPSPKHVVKPPPLNPDAVETVLPTAGHHLGKPLLAPGSASKEHSATPADQLAPLKQREVKPVHRAPTPASSSGHTSHSARIKTLDDVRTSPEPTPTVSSNQKSRVHTLHDGVAGPKSTAPWGQVSPSSRKKTVLNGVLSSSPEQVTVGAQKSASNGSQSVNSGQGSPPERLKLTHKSRLLKEDEERRLAQAKSVLQDTQPVPAFSPQKYSAGQVPDHQPSKNEVKSRDEHYQSDPLTLPSAVPSIPVCKEVSPVAAMSHHSFSVKRQLGKSTTLSETAHSTSFPEMEHLPLASLQSQHVELEKDTQKDWQKSTQGLPVPHVQKLKLFSSTKQPKDKRKQVTFSNRQGDREYTKGDYEPHKDTFESTKKLSIDSTEVPPNCLSQEQLVTTKQPPSIVNKESSTHIRTMREEAQSNGSNGLSVFTDALKKPPPVPEYLSATTLNTPKNEDIVTETFEEHQVLSDDTPHHSGARSQTVSPAPSHSEKTSSSHLKEKARSKQTLKSEAAISSMRSTAEHQSSKGTVGKKVASRTSPKLKSSQSSANDRRTTPVSKQPLSVVKRDTLRQNGKSKPTVTKTKSAASTSTTLKTCPRQQSISASRKLKETTRKVSAKNKATSSPKTAKAIPEPTSKQSKPVKSAKKNCLDPQDKPSTKPVRLEQPSTKSANDQRYLQTTPPLNQTTSDTSLQGGSESSDLQENDSSQRGQACSSPDISSVQKAISDRPIPKDEYDLVFKMISPKVEKWKFLGRYLDISDEKLDHISTSLQANDERCRELLCEWSKTYKERATYLELRSALERIQQDTILSKVWYEESFVLPLSNEGFDSVRDALHQRRNNECCGIAFLKCIFFYNTSSIDLNCSKALSVQLISNDVDIIRFVCSGAKNEGFERVLVVLIVSE